MWRTRGALSSDVIHSQIKIPFRLRGTIFARDAA